MAKKHRVKRQKYVDLLIKVEKEREAYIQHRKKRSREDDGAAERPVDEDESQRKKRRVDPAAAEGTSNVAAPAPVAEGSVPKASETETAPTEETTKSVRKVGTKTRRY